MKTSGSWKVTLLCSWSEKVSLQPPPNGKHRVLMMLLLIHWSVRITKNKLQYQVAGCESYSVLFYCCIPGNKNSIINDISSVIYNYQSVNKYPWRTIQDHQQSVPKAVMVAQNKSNLTENKLTWLNLVYPTQWKIQTHVKCEDRDLRKGKRQWTFGKQSRLQNWNEPLSSVTQCADSDVFECKFPLYYCLFTATFSILSEENNWTC